MLKEALQYLVSLKDNKTYVINGDTYSDRELHRIAPHVDRPDQLTVNGLDSIVKLVRAEMDMMENLPLFIQVEGPRHVSVLSTLDSVMGRDKLYRAVCDTPEFRPGWRSQDETIIELRTKFLPNEDLDYMLDLLSRIVKEDGVSSDDNGVSQTVTTRSGVHLKATMAVRSRVALIPFRSFREVAQPESEFIVRLDDNGRIGILDADGGLWQMQAKLNIQKYFEAELAEEIKDGKVLVMV